MFYQWLNISTLTLFCLFPPIQCTNKHPRLEWVKKLDTIIGNLKTANGKGYDIIKKEDDEPFFREQHTTTPPLWLGMAKLCNSPITTITFYKTNFTFPKEFPGASSLTLRLINSVVAIYLTETTKKLMCSAKGNSCVRIICTPATKKIDIETFNASLVMCKNMDAKSLTVKGHDFSRVTCMGNATTSNIHCNDQSRFNGVVWHQKKPINNHDNDEEFTQLLTLGKLLKNRWEANKNRAGY